MPLLECPHSFLSSWIWLSCMSPFGCLPFQKVSWKSFHSHVMGLDRCLYFILSSALSYHPPKLLTHFLKINKCPGKRTSFMSEEILFIVEPLEKLTQYLVCSKCSKYVRWMETWMPWPSLFFSFFLSFFFFLVLLIIYFSKAKGFFIKPLIVNIDYILYLLLFYK